MKTRGPGYRRHSKKWASVRQGADEAFDVGSDMVQILALPKSGDRLIAGLFQAGQIVMLDTLKPIPVSILTSTQRSYRFSHVRTAPQ